MKDLGRNEMKGAGTLRVRTCPANLATSKKKRPKELRGLRRPVPKRTATSQSLYKCNSRRGPVSIPSRQQNLATSITWFWLKSCEGHRSKASFVILQD